MFTMSAAPPMRTIRDHGTWGNIEEVGMLTNVL
jgi:hypothetical protein